MPEHHVLAALAEAWHVDRRYEPAAKAWELLATAGPDPGEAALKAAISWYAHGDIQRGNDWLAQARARGVAPAEWRYVHAQRLWAERAWDRAIGEFRAAAAEDPRSGRALNTLGSLLWKVGRASDARALVHEALQRDPHDPCALANRVSICLEDIDLDEGHELLTRAATALERIEPFVLAARLLRRRRLEADARAALVKARLRDRWLGPIGGSPAPAGATLRAHVTGELTAALSLEVTLHRLDGAVPAAFAVNPGYDEILVDGRTAIAEVRDGRRIFAVAWAGAAPSMVIALRGRLTGPYARFDVDEIELDGRSHWLPVAVPRAPIQWTLDVRWPAGFSCISSSSRPESDGVGLVAIRAPAHAAVGGVTALGRTSEGALRVAASLAGRAAQLWADAGAPPRAVPPIVVTDQPRSARCFTGAGFVRLARGALECDARTALVFREIGRLWWGVDTRFTEDDAWLAEALAEYTLHLAEDAGVIDCARATLELVERSCDAAMIAEPLSRLWRASRGDDAESRRRALVLRVKGGYMIRALRTLLGDDRFRAFLRLLCAAGDHQPLHGYTFFALASQLHGSSLTWFANQWAHVPAAVVLEADVDRVASFRGGHRIELLARVRGAMTLGAPIDIEVPCADGSAARTRAALDVGPQRLTITTTTRPVAVVLDPERRWFATRRNVHLEPA